MTEEIENLNSTNEADEVETSEEETTTEDSHEGLTDREKQFLARAKKAESKLKEFKGSKSEEKAVEPNKSKQDDFDYGQLAYMEMKGVKTDEEIVFVKKMMERTGETLKQTLNDDFVKNRLKSIREQITVESATPTNTKRAQPSGKNSVDYWLAKGELPPTDQVQLRRDVLNAKIEREKQRSKFSDNAIVIQGQM
jgi:hypothetical protein